MFVGKSLFLPYRFHSFEFCMCIHVDSMYIHSLCPVSSVLVTHCMCVVVFTG